MAENTVPAELAHNDQYEIIRELGRGGRGVVYLAKNKVMDRLEALKVINQTLMDVPGSLERFLREIRAAARLNHENVVKAHSAMKIGDLLVFAMEYVEGQDLAKFVKAHGPMPVAHACYYVRKAALGLQHAHEKEMVHRDIKPRNLILARQGKKHTLKILDFGLAKATSEETAQTKLTSEGKMLGTPDYMAPEQMQDAASADIRADIYSLGCTLYYVLAGVPCFQAKNLMALMYAHQTQEPEPLSKVRPDVPTELAAVVTKMMAKNPDKRFQTPNAVAEALLPFIKTGAKEGSAAALTPSTKAARSDSHTNTASEQLTIPVSVFPSRPEQAGSSASKPAGKGGKTEKGKRAGAAATAPTGKSKLPLWAGVLGLGLCGLMLLVVGVLWMTGVFGGSSDQVHSKGDSHEAKSKPPKEPVGEREAPVPVKPKEDSPKDAAEAPKDIPAEKKPVASAKSKEGSPKSPAKKPSTPKPAHDFVLLKTLTGHAGPVPQVIFSPDGATLASASHDFTVKLWDTASLKERTSLQGHTQFVVKISFSPDSRMLASASHDFTVKLWDVPGGALRKTLIGHKGYVKHVTFSPDGRTVASSGWDNTAKLWDVASGNGLFTLEGHKQGVKQVSFSPDDRALASAGYDNAVKLWAVARGIGTATLTGHADHVGCVCFSPDGRTIASSSDDGTVKLWDAYGGRLKSTLAGHKGGVAQVSYSPEGQTLASSSGDGTVKIWDAVSGQDLFTLTGHKAGVGQISFRPDGGMLASASADGTVKLWDTASGKELPPALTGHKGDVYGVTFNPDGRTLATSGKDGTVKVWGAK